MGLAKSHLFYRRGAVYSFCENKQAHKSSLICLVEFGPLNNVRNIGAGYSKKQKFNVKSVTR